MKRKLFNPGPTNVSEDVRDALKTHDICHREKEFFEVLSRLNKNIVKALNGEETHEAVLFVSSGTGCNEAICAGIQGKVLVLNNGKYSGRICAILDRYKIPVNKLVLPPLEKMDLKKIEDTLIEDNEITHIYLVHHETTTGVLAPLRDIGKLAEKYNKSLCVDSVSGIGCHDFDLKEDNIDFCAVSANKGLQSFPGVSFVIAKRDKLEELEGKSRSFYFDLYAQWKKGQDGETPFTPAVQLIFALDKSIQELLEEGYQNRVERHKRLVKKMRGGLEELGFELILPPEEIRSNILTAVKMPDEMDYWKVHDKLKERGITIYSGKGVLDQRRFRVATLGCLTEEDIDWFLRNLKEVTDEEGLFESKAIILVAGRGSRLKPLTDSLHKCLTEVNGKPILINALENLEKLGIKETVLVVGYLGSQIKERIGDKFGNMEITYVENNLYAITNTSYSLHLGLQNLNLRNNLLILEGDVFFEENLLKNFIKHKANDSTIVQKYNPNLDGSFVTLNKNIVTGWIHKSRRGEDFIIEDSFKTVNIHKFSKKFIENTLKPVLKKRVEEFNGSEPLEYVMQDIVRSENEIKAFEVGELKWFEIDDENELKIAEEIFKDTKKKLSIEESKHLYGGYWNYNFLDFHYLINCHFPTKDIFEKLTKKLPTLTENYPSTQRIIADKISMWKNKSYFKKENIVATNGSSEAIRALNQIINKITIPIPTFNEYVELSPEKINYFLLPEEEKFRLDADKLIEEIRISQSDFAVVNNPNNPNGYVTPREDIIKILETGVNLIVDEAFIDFSIENSVEDLIEEYSNLIIVKTVTKTMGLAGLRLGYVLTKNKKIIQKIKNILPIWNINSIAEYFVEIFPEHEKEYWESIERTRKERQDFFEELKKFSFLEPYETGGNFIFCKTKISSRKIAEFLYDKYNILLRFQLNQKTLQSDNYIRISVRTEKDNNQLLQALKEFEKSLNNF